MADRIHQSRRGLRELPGASVRVRGQNDLPYNPGRPLRLPRDRKPFRPPQFNLGALLRLLLPVAVLAGLGIGVFFAVDALIGDDESSPGTGQAAVTDADVDADVPPIDASTADVPTPGDAATADDASVDGGTANGDAAVDTADTTTDVPRAEQIITPADLGGAAVIMERGAARPVPSGIPGRTLADGSAYDPTDSAAVFSSVWAAGTVLEVTRLPGAPLLSDEEAAELVGKTVRLSVVAVGEFPEELQLTPAAYGLLAQDIEPIIAVRIEVVEAPPAG